jgi:3-oxoacyl-[acyl-carrier-protein] synthase I
LEKRKWFIVKTPIIYQQANNIISPLGFTTDENFQAVVSGKSNATYYPEGTYGLKEAFFGSKLDDELLENAFAQINNLLECSRLEKMAILSVCKAVEGTNIDLVDEQTLFILSTTKGNVFLLDENENLNEDQLLLSYSAKLIANFFGNKNRPIVVSNACISGVSAQIMAKRFLQSGKYKHAVVIGADTLSKFVVSGFQSFKALSMEGCKPFDASRNGLNLGEGAATIVYSAANDEDSLPAGTIVLENGAITNDANHISGPSRTGEGLFLALDSIMKGQLPDNIGFVNAHGTATPYNDEMESIALSRAGLDVVPVNSLKGYFGHTLGASGLIESIISAKSLTNNILIKSLGYDVCGTTHSLPVITEVKPAKINKCIKMASGFGGCNAAIMLKKIG